MEDPTKNQVAFISDLRNLSTAALILPIIFSDRIHLIDLHNYKCSRGWWTGWLLLIVSITTGIWFQHRMVWTNRLSVWSHYLTIISFGGGIFMTFTALVFDYFLPADGCFPPK